MGFTRFEQVVLLAGGAAILASMVFSVTNGGVDYVEIVAQALLFCVLFAAVRLGRRGGATAAMLASVAYALMAIARTTHVIPTGGDMTVLVLRLLSFGAVGIVGGELFTRFRYGLTRFGHGSALDDWSRVFNQAYIHTAISLAVARHKRYHDPVSLVLVSLTDSLFTGMKPMRQRGLVRAVAGVIRADVRMIDEVARLTDGRFVVLMPHTNAEGGAVVRDRLRGNVATALGTGIDNVSARLLSLPDDEAPIASLVASIGPRDEIDQLASCAYSSAADITLNPALVSAVSAPSASTLKTSTAASPEGSTKQ